MNLSHSLVCLTKFSQSLNSQVFRWDCISILSPVLFTEFILTLVSSFFLTLHRLYPYPHAHKYLLFDVDYFCRQLTLHNLRWFLWCVFEGSVLLILGIFWLLGSWPAWIVFFYFFYCKAFRSWFPSTFFSILLFSLEIRYSYLLLWEGKWL